MSMHYTRNKYRIIDAVSSGDVSDLPAPPIQLHFYEREAKYGQDVCSNADLMHINMKKNAERSAENQSRISSTSSPSPPESSISSDTMSRPSLESHVDSYSRECAQAYLNNRLAEHHHHLHDFHVSDPSFVESPESIQNYSTAAQSMQAGGENGVQCDDEKLMKRMLEDLKGVLLGPDGDDHQSSVEFIGGDSSVWADLLNEEAQSAAMPDDDKVLGLQKPDPYCDDGSLPYPGSLSDGSTAILRDNQGCRVKNLLIMCAAAIDEDRLDMAAAVMQELRKVVSVYGDPIERLAAYMSEGLVARLQASGLSIYRILRCFEAPSADVLSAMEKLYEICPYIKFGYMAANGAIAEAFQGEAEVHVFDFNIGQGTQWFSLIQGLASRPGGPPTSIQITTFEEKGVDGSSPIGGMKLVEQKLREFTESFGIPFRFNCISSRLCDLRSDMIGVRKGEALAVNFTLQLHHVPDESVSLTNERDRIIRMMKGLNPKVLTMVELEANTNTAPFLLRFMETLATYSAIFESIDVALPRESKDRVNVEEQCLARDIVNVIACEGLERIERHELMGKWRARMKMAGFQPRRMSDHVNSIIKTLLQSYNSNYTLKEEENALFLGWLNRSLIVASAWH